MTRRLAHISDLHFGRIDPAVVEGLARSLAEARPDLVVVSGDFTQRARDSEFAAARAFLDRLPAPVFTVPGNHDLPPWNLLERFADPYRRYRRHISRELEPTWTDDEVGVVGIKSSRRLPPGVNWAVGRIGRRQLERSLARLDALPAHLVRVVVVHHPLLLPEEPGKELRPSAVTGSVARAPLEAFAARNVQLVLSGHLHLSYSRRRAPAAPEGPPTVGLPGAGAAGVKAATAPVPAGPLVVQAASATSTRLRDEPNAYNLITVGGGKVEVEVHAWDGRQLFAAVRPVAPAAAESVGGGSSNP